MVSFKVFAPARQRSPQILGEPADVLVAGFVAGHRAKNKRPPERHSACPNEVRRVGRGKFAFFA
ncbi:MAG: hypothetical protein Q8L26_04315 [Candidatus Omnitrophota bacterium]|nr:hypothetical protein [Candidatus Omnitrophota bacterium]